MMANGLSLHAYSVLYANVNMCAVFGTNESCYVCLGVCGAMKPTNGHQTTSPRTSSM